jgi:hypothetical protein
MVTALRTLCAFALLVAPSLVAAQPQSRTHDTGAVQFDVYDNGELGAYSNAAGISVGTGFAFGCGGDNGLFEATFLVGRSATQVSGEAYELSNAVPVEWVATSAFSTITPPEGFDEAYQVSFNDSGAPNPIGVLVTEQSYSNTGDPFVVVDFDITNTTGAALSGIHVGIFADWDILSADFTDDLGGYDAGTQLLYVYDADGSSTAKHYGVVALEGTTGTNVTGVDYDDDGFPGDAELWDGLTTIESPPATTADRRTVIGVGPYSIGAGQTVNVKFAFVGGSSLADIIANAAAAQAAVGAPSFAGGVGAGAGISLTYGEGHTLVACRPQTGARFGDAVSGVPDLGGLNGTTTLDNRDDLLVGAP